VFNDFVSDMAVDIGKLDNLARKTAEHNDTVKQTAGC